MRLLEDDLIFYFIVITLIITTVALELHCGRRKTEENMYILVLNDMRCPKFEDLGPVCRAETREELEAFLAQQTVTTYRDPKVPGGDIDQVGWWGKSFKKGGPLEWYNTAWEPESFVHIVEPTPMAMLVPTIEALKNAYES